MTSASFARRVKTATQRQVHTDRWGFLGRQNGEDTEPPLGSKHGRGGKGEMAETSQRGLYPGVSDDALAAMAMAAMTKELDQLKESLQEEVCQPFLGLK